jgi:hypothetical protein
MLDLTKEELRALKSLVDWYDQHWTIGGIRTRTAELYDTSYQRFHAVAQALDMALTNCDLNHPGPIGDSVLVNLADYDIFVAPAGDLVRLFLGKSARLLIDDTVCEASHDLHPDPIIASVRQKFVRYEPHSPRKKRSRV